MQTSCSILIGLVFDMWCQTLSDSSTHLQVDGLLSYPHLPVSLIYSLTLLTPSFFLSEFSVACTGLRNCRSTISSYGWDLGKRLAGQQLFACNGLLLPSVNPALFNLLIGDIFFDTVAIGSTAGRPFPVLLLIWTSRGKKEEKRKYNTSARISGVARSVELVGPGP